MTDEPPASRRELDMLRQMTQIETAKIWARIESMDDHGTRGVGVIAVRMDSLIHDVAELKTEVRTDVAALDGRFDTHQKLHETEARDRRDSRRWRVTAIGAGAASMAAVIGLLLEVLARVR